MEGRKIIRLKCYACSVSNVVLKLHMDFLLAPQIIIRYSHVVMLL